MQVYLAGVAPWQYEGLYDDTIKKHKPYILESFVYANQQTENMLKFYGDFLLDSGAFTFIQNSTTETAWDDYVEQYAEFIKRNNVKKYFELDIDNIMDIAHNSISKRVIAT